MDPPLFQYQSGQCITFDTAQRMISFQEQWIKNPYTNVPLSDEERVKFVYFVRVWKLYLDQEIHQRVVVVLAMILVRTSLSVVNALIPKRSSLQFLKEQVRVLKIIDSCIEHATSPKFDLGWGRQKYENLVGKMYEYADRIVDETFSSSKPLLKPGSGRKSTRKEILEKKNADLLKKYGKVRRGRREKVML